MNPLRRTEYLSQVKNYMLLHFCHSDIVSVLKDLKEIFLLGKEAGKTEEELCRELGTPKEFVGSLRKESTHDRFFTTVLLYAISAVILCVAVEKIFSPLTPVFWCIPALITPLYLWHFCGGKSLCEMEPADGKGEVWRLLVVGLGGMGVVAIQQIFLILLNAQLESGDFSTIKSSVSIVYYLSTVSIGVFAVFFIATVYRLYKGNYFSLYVMFLEMGTICSSLFYVIYMSSFNGNGNYIPACAAPYLLNVILCVGVTFYFKGKGSKPLWNRK